MKKLLGLVMLGVVFSGCSMFDKNTIKEAKCDFSETSETVVVNCVAPKAPTPKK